MTFLGINILLVLLLLAKELLVFNAETLILILFILFINTLTIQLKTNIIEAFEEISGNIKKEFYTQRTEVLNSLKTLEQNLIVAQTITNLIKNYIKFYKNSNIIYKNYSEKNLKIKKNNHIKEQLQKIALIESQTKKNLQNSICQLTPNKIRQTFAQNENQEAILEINIENLNSTSEITI